MALLLFTSRVSAGTTTGGGDGGDDKVPKFPADMVVVESIFDFESTWDTLVTTLQNNPNIRMVGEVLHSDAAAAAGLSLANNRLVVFGNPNLGTPFMQERRSVGIDLPQKILVWQPITNGPVYVGYNPVSYLDSRHEGVAAAPTADRVAGALLNLASTASGVAMTDITVPTNLADDDQDSGLISTASDADFDTTYNRLKEAIGGALFLEVDHRANSGDVLPNTKLIVFGNPMLGTPLMQVAPTAGLDLPLKILVWQGDDGVYVTTNDIDFLKRRHGIVGVDDTLDTIRGVVNRFVQAATVTA